ncbi:hypothetical protein CKO25_10475 [Thiocapsa imhoffii]|uniref:Glycosyl transferase family 1 domain-containing protein n=1 Tax=Thiocapsa imhoffii TaxID=382777 RepID=A0A9X0WIU8_9GAMM|nr:glycosyltransferase family 4 protein [Thiocapsa imhoffii]MBK1645069.1 hypothetical protein [Thiocapsa imhoffii]
MRLGILTTHPIQYQVPWFRLLAQQPGIDLEVLYCMLPDAAQQGSGFGVAFEWDVPLLDGYRYRVLENRAAAPDVTTFDGCDTPEIFRILRKESWDAFIVNGWVAKSCLQLLAACRLNAVPCLVRGESNAIRPRAAWKRGVHRVLLSQYAAFLAIGSQNRAFYSANGVPSDRIFDAPYCVENARFAFEGRRARTDPPFRFLFSGKLIPKKRPMDVMRALAWLRAQAPDLGVELVVAGDGELRGECESFAASERLPVRFSGFLNQTLIGQAYRDADCLLLPSDHGETWGLVVNEAMASGMPAIVSDQVGCHPDLIVAGETGWTFSCGDVEGLGRCMRQMAEDPKRAHAMGQTAARRVCEGFSYERVTGGTLTALRWLGARQ